MEQDWFTCPRCLMLFRVGTPKRGRGEYTRCAEPKCHRPFWHTDPANGQHVHCYVEPEYG